MQCEHQDCEKEAAAIAHWPGGDTEQCEEHCRGLDTVKQVMGGGRLRFTSLETGQTMKFRPKA